MRAQLLSALLIAFGLAGPAQAQVRIVGRVIDDLAKRPLSQTAITIFAKDGSTLGRAETGMDGTFEFPVNNVTSVRIGAPSGRADRPVGRLQLHYTDLCGRLPGKP